MPEAARTAIIRRTEAGETITIADIRGEVAAERNRAAEAAAFPLVEMNFATREEDARAANPVVRAWEAATAAERAQFATLYHGAVRHYAEPKGRPESPTFIARFADGIETRMTVATRLDALNVRRGVKLARAAYWSRTKRVPPAITEARFENGKILATYRALPPPGANR